jgi:hypothetical protein
MTAGQPGAHEMKRRRHSSRYPIFYQADAPNPGQHVASRYTAISTDFAGDSRLQTAPLSGLFNLHSTCNFLNMDRCWNEMAHISFQQPSYGDRSSPSLVERLEFALRLNALCSRQMEHACCRRVSQRGPSFLMPLPGRKQKVLRIFYK